MLTVLTMLNTVCAMADVWVAPDSIEARADAYLNPYIEMDLFSGSVLLARADSVLLCKGYGLADREAGTPNTPETRFPIGSITKDFTWLTLIQLKGLGQLEYQAPIATYVSDWPQGDRITINHLANHRAGLVNLEDLPGYAEWERRHWTFPEVLDLLRQEPLVSSPGGPENYGSSSYILLAHVIESITDRTFAEHLEASIFDPSGMTNTGDGAPTGSVPDGARGTMPDLDGEGLMDAPPIDLSIKYGSGSFYSTVDDLYRFRRNLMANRLTAEVGGNHIFRPEQRNGQLAAEHSGSIPGYSAMVREYLRPNLIIIVLCNNYAQVQRQIVNDLSNLLLGEPYDIPEMRMAQAADPVNLDGAVGAYRFDFGETGRIDRLDGGYVLSFDRGRDTPLWPQEDGGFFLPLWWALLHFEWNDDGTVAMARWTDIGTGNVAIGEPMDPSP